ncbi:MAG: Nramp family divalent metal transporter [Sedimentisphaerales bacterium]|nr:Nramp family divalent metal transporter [Sedimentisphaerales bacterium]
MAQSDTQGSGARMASAPTGLAILAVVGPSMVWAAEYIGSGEVIVATRTGAILGAGVLWAVVIGVFLKFWIGMAGARYTVCTGEGMMDMFDRMPGPRHWAVWVVLVAHIAAGAFSIGAVATAAGVFVGSLMPADHMSEGLARHCPTLCGWGVTFFALAVVWSGTFGILKKVMSFLVLVVVLGVIYVAAYALPGLMKTLGGFSLHVPAVPDWALQLEGVSANPWKEILPLLGWSAGGFASQVWYTYWVIGAGYGATAGRGYGKAADVAALKSMTTDTARKIKGWCRVLYSDASLAMVVGIAVTSAFLIAGAGILGPAKIAPEGPQVALELSNVFSSRWGAAGGFLFILAGAAALISTQVGQLAGWPRLLADCFRICIPGFDRKLTWKWQFRLFLLFFMCTNMILIFVFKGKAVFLVQFAAILDGLLLTPLQALCVAVGLFVVMPRLLSAEAVQILRAHWVFAVGLLIAFLVFGYFCAFQIPSAVGAMFSPK